LKPTGLPQQFFNLLFQYFVKGKTVHSPVSSPANH
jgi:hypothetical protein